MRLHHSVRFVRQDVESILERFMSAGVDVFPCGSWRRKSETVGDLDLVIVGDVDVASLYHSTQAIDLFEGRRTHLFYDLNGRRFEVEITSTDQDHLGGALLHCTGSARWNHYLRTKASLKGWRLSERGLYEGDRCLAAATEGEILEKLEEEWKNPELR
jgi:DNA polymerase (family 10)